MAIAGASVIAVNPIAPTLPAIQDRSVELSAWIDPIGVWGDTITTTVENLGARGNGLVTDGLPGAWALISNSSIYREIAAAVFDPAPGLEQFFNNLSTYSATLKTGLEGSSTGLTEHVAELPATLQAAWDYVKQGQFTLAFASITSWSIFGLGEFGWPLEPAFKIPGEIARDFGLTAVAAVLDEVFVANNAATGYAYSLLSPPITAIYQLTDILNVVSASIYDGDWVTAVSEVVNAPAKVLNAFLNGYQPSVAYEWETFPGIFSEGGPIDAFFVKLPKAIAAALAELPGAEQAGDSATANSTLAEVSSTQLRGTADLVTVDVSIPAATEEPAPATDEESAPTEAPDQQPGSEGTPSVDEQTDSVDDTAPENEDATDESGGEAADAEGESGESAESEDSADGNSDADKTDGDETAAGKSKGGPSAGTSGDA